MKCESNLCSYDVRVNDLHALSVRGEESLSFNIPLNNMIIESGNMLFTIKILTFPIDSKQKSFFSIKIEHYELDVDKNEILDGPNEVMSYLHSPNSSNIIERLIKVDVPYRLKTYTEAEQLSNRRDLIRIVTDSVNHFRQMIKQGNYEEFLDCLKTHDDNIANSLYWQLSKEDSEFRIQEFKELMMAGYNFKVVKNLSLPSFYGYGKLIRYEDKNGESAIVMQNESTGDEYPMDLYLYLPQGSNLMQLY